MKALLTFITLCALGATAHAEIRTIKCTTKFKGKTESIQLKFDEKGNFRLWSESQIAKAPKGSLFELFNDVSMDQGGGLDYAEDVKAPGGYSVLRIGTTADQFQIGMKRDLSKAFWKYIDRGSGAGNDEGPLTCVEK